MAKTLTRLLKAFNIKQTNKQTYYCGMEGGSVIY